MGSGKTKFATWLRLHRIVFYPLPLFGRHVTGLGSFFPFSLWGGELKDPWDEDVLRNADLEFPWMQIRRKDVAIPLNGKLIATQPYGFVAVTIRTLQYCCKKKENKNNRKRKTNI